MSKRPKHLESQGQFPNKKRKVSHDEKVEQNQSIDDCFDNAFHEQFLHASTELDKMEVCAEYGVEPPFSIKPHMLSIITNRWMTDKVVEKVIKENIQPLCLIYEEKKQLSEDDVVYVLKFMFSFRKRFQTPKDEVLKNVKRRLIELEYTEAIKYLFVRFDAYLKSKDWVKMIQQQNKKMILFFHEEMYQPICLNVAYLTMSDDEKDMLRFMFNHQVLHWNSGFVSLFASERNKDRLTKILQFVYNETKDVHLILDSLRIENYESVLTFLKDNNLFNLTKEKCFRLCYQELAPGEDRYRTYLRDMYRPGDRVIIWLLKNNIITNDELFEFTIRQSGNGNEHEIYQTLKENGFICTEDTLKSISDSCKSLHQLRRVFGLQDPNQEETNDNDEYEDGEGPRIRDTCYNFYNPCVDE
jgi:hypothetical protein